MILFEKSHPDQLAVEQDILNSVPEFNHLSHQRPDVTEAEILQQHQEAAKIGAERYLVKQEGRYIGVLEFLPLNPADQMPWLGLLVIHGEEHRKGLASLAYQQFEAQLRQRGYQALRLGVIRDNQAGTEFWNKMGFVHYAEKSGIDGMLYDCYEKRIEER